MLAGAVAGRRAAAALAGDAGGRAWTFPVALGVAFITGAAQPAWSIGYSRFLFMDVVPAGGTAQYMAAFYAWAGITGAAGAMLAGRTLQSLQAVLGPAAAGGLDAYAIVFVVSAVMALGGLAVLRQVRSQQPAAGG